MAPSLDRSNVPVRVFTTQLQSKSPSSSGSAGRTRKECLRTLDVFRRRHGVIDMPARSWGSSCPALVGDKLLPWLHRFPPARRPSKMSRELDKIGTALSNGRSLQTRYLATKPQTNANIKTPTIYTSYRGSAPMRQLDDGPVPVSRMASCVAFNLKAQTLWLMVNYFNRWSYMIQNKYRHHYRLTSRVLPFYYFFFFCLKARFVIELTMYDSDVRINHAALGDGSRYKVLSDTF